MVWNRNKEPQNLLVDGIKVILKCNQIMTLTYLQKAQISSLGSKPLTTFSFNREFYCINTQDHEVSCSGIIFFGALDTPIITLSQEEIGKFELLFSVFLDEFQTRDNIQGEMLQMLLKRLIIKTTRIAKAQRIPHDLKADQLELVRKFNALVDLHYKEKRTVAEYADMLYKSPKTLSNTFSKYSGKTPLQVIHERIILETKRQLLFTDKTVKEISHELGFHEVASFHKMFKKVTGETPQQFKEHKQAIKPS